jgi:5-formyltetrahydrofolate cyclo-ligase
MTNTRTVPIPKHGDRRLLRQRILAARDALPPEIRHHRSQEALRRLWQLPEFAAAETVCLYVSFRSELETLPLIRQCLARGKQVAVPLTCPDPPHLEAYRIAGLDELRPGYCGILEPAPLHSARVEPRTIEVVIVPGSVFDSRGGRLGYGGGYYDRFLGGEAPGALRIGLCFELQLVAEVPLLPHDQRLDFLVTEKRLTAIPRGNP